MNTLNAKLIYTKNKTACILTPSGQNEIVTATIENNHGIWCISSWYNHTENLRRQGYGKICMRILVEDLLDKGMPESVTYIWNGTNDYVGRLVTETWGGICKTPLSVLKNETTDSWDCHQYDLDKTKFFNWVQSHLTMKQKNSYAKNEVTCPITELLDDSCSLTKASPHFRHYILADTVSLREPVTHHGRICRCLSIRRPGRTMGGIWLDEKDRIIDIIVETDSSYADDTVPALNRFAAAHLILPETH